MSLLHEIDINARLRPLQQYMEGLNELGIDPNHEAAYSNIVRIFMEALDAEDVDQIDEQRSEYAAGQEMMRGAGVDMDKEKMQRTQRVNRMGLNNPRLGLQAHDPQPGDRVKLAIGNQVGQVMKVNGNEIAIKDRMGNSHEIPRHMLKAYARQNSKGGNEIVWVEQ